jgi:DNA-3-methyladenine glycosylase
LPWPAADVRLPAARATWPAAPGLRREHDGDDVCAGGPVVVRAGTRPTAAVLTGPRVGVAGAGGDAESFPWRYWLDDEPTVSVYRPAKPRRRATT